MISFSVVSAMQSGSVFQSSFRPYYPCPYPGCMDDRNSEHVCRPSSLSYQTPSESHVRLQATSLLQMPGDPRLYTKTDRSQFFSSAAFGVFSRPSGFYLPSSHCLTRQQLIFPFSDASQVRQHGK